MPKSRPFRVAGIFYSGMFEYDSKFVYIHLREAQSFFGIKGASGVEIKVDDVDNARGIMKRIYDSLDGYPYRTKDWGEMNRNLFAALRLEKLVMAIILTIIVIVAAGLIVAMVIMLVLVVVIFMLMCLAVLLYRLEQLPVLIQDAPVGRSLGPRAADQGQRVRHLAVHCGHHLGHRVNA
jgi:hypothetical protein